MKKLLLFFMASIVTMGGFISCSNDDDVSNPTLSLDKKVYTLSAEEGLDVVLTASAAVKEDLTVPFTLSGSAVEDEDFTLSADHFVIKAGEKSAKITVTPKDNFEADRSIVLKLSNTIAGFDMGVNSTTVITVEPKETIIYSFSTDYYVMTQSVDVTLEIKGMNGDYVPTEDMHIPFVVDEASTALKGTHFTMEDDATEFVILKGEKKAVVRINYVLNEQDKNKLVLKVGDLSKRFIPGDFDEAHVKVYGPTTIGKLFGKWAYDSFVNKEWLETNVYPSSDVENLPENNTSADVIEFTTGEKDALKVTMTGDLNKYFRDCTLEYVGEELERYQESGYPPKKANITFMTMSNANVNFAIKDVTEQAAKIGFRVLEDNETLEVSIVEYAPTEFLVETYTMMKQYSNEGDIPMRYYPLRFYFTKVNE